MILKNNYAVIKVSKKIERLEIGRKMGNLIYLHPIEAVYLVTKNYIKFDLKKLLKWAEHAVKDFQVYYVVYEDLRNKGYRVKPKGQLLIGKKAFLPISENKTVKIPEIAEKSKEFLDFILAVVDDESEITYYKVYIPELKGEQNEDLNKIKGLLIGDRIFVKDTNLFKKFFYGNELNGFTVLSLIEGIYLAEKEILEVCNAKLEELIERAKKSIKDFDRKYEVYKDLKERGFVVKTGFKFGSDFRVYSKVVDVEDLPHSEYLVSIVDDRDVSLSEIARAVRLAQNVRKKILFAYKNNYLCIERIRV